MRAISSISVSTDWAPSAVEAALRGVDRALDVLCDQLGLKNAA